MAIAAAEKILNPRDLVLEHRIEVVGMENFIIERLLDRMERLKTVINSLIALYPYEKKQKKETIPLPLPQGFLKEFTASLKMRTTPIFNEVIDQLRQDLIEIAEIEHLFQYNLLRGEFFNEEEARAAGFVEMTTAEWIRAASTAGIYEPMPTGLATEMIDKPAHWDGLPFMKRFKDIKDRDIVRDMRTSLIRSLREGDGMDRASRNLHKILNQTYYRAETIARTEIQRVTNLVSDNYYLKNQELISGVQCVATLDSRTCPICGAYDGREFYFNPTKGQASIEDAPVYPQHPRCRCTKMPISRLWERLGVTPPEARSRASMFGTVPAEMDFPGWLKKMDSEGHSEIPKRVLGSLYTVWKAGSPLESFVNRRGIVTMAAYRQILRKKAAVVKRAKRTLKTPEEIEKEMAES